MKLFLDENLPKSLVKELEETGFEVEHARYAGFLGANDGEIANYAKKQNAILVTKDLEFGSLIFYPKGSHHGLIVLRLPNNFDAEKIIKYIKNFLKSFEVEKLPGKLIVLEVGRYRIREI